MLPVTEVLIFNKLAEWNKKVNNTDLELKDRLVAINRVTKVTKGGRTFSFRSYRCGR